MRFKDMKIGVRMGLGFGLLIAMLLANDPVHITAVKAAIEVNKKTIGQALETLDQTIDLPQEGLLLSQLKEARAKYVQSFSQVSQLVAEGKREQAVDLLNRQTLPSLDALQVPINALTDLQSRSARLSPWPARLPLAI